MRLLFLFVFVLLAPIALQAEYRAALLIQHESGSDVAPVKAALERSGFYCSVVTELKGDKSVRDAIGDFAARTPTRGTALVYYSGDIVTIQGREGSKTIGLPHNEAREGQGYSLSETLNSLKTRGGSLVDLFFLDSKVDPEIDELELPENTAIIVGEGASLASKLRSGDLLANLKSAGRRIFANLPSDLRLDGPASRAVSPPDKFPSLSGRKAGDEWVNSRGMVFCWIPPGTFIMGSPEGTPGRYPDEEQRQVSIAEGFWMQKYELTRGHFASVGKNMPREMVGDHKLHPLNKYHMDDGKTIGRNLTKSELQAGRLPEGWEYSQPSEEQWEYAARAGTQTTFFFGNDVSELPRYANFADKSYYDTGDIYSNYANRVLDDGAPGPSLVGSFLPNPWGLHDVYGNVSEWCENGSARGGSRISLPENCRSAYRDSYSSRSDQNYLGYRLVIRKAPATPPKPKK